MLTHIEFSVSNVCVASREVHTKCGEKFLGELPLDCIPVCNGVAPKMFDSKISDPLQK